MIIDFWTFSKVKATYWGFTQQDFVLVLFRIDPQIVFEKHIRLIRRNCNSNMYTQK